MNTYFKNLFILLFIILMTQKSFAYKYQNRHENKTKKVLTVDKMRKLYNTEVYKSFYVFLKVRGIENYYIPRLFCIAKLESDLDPYAVNYNKNGTFDVGLLQINSVWQKTCGKSLHDIETNITCARVVLKKQGLTAWVTYKKWGQLCEKSLHI